MLRLIFLIVSLCAVAPASAMPARPSSPNIASSILLNVGGRTILRDVGGRSEVKPDLPPGERAKRDRAVREMGRTFGIDADESHLAPSPPSQADLGGWLRRSPDGKLQDKKDLVLGKRPDPGHLLRTYNNHTRTYDDSPKYLWAREPDPPIVVKKERTVDDTEPRVRDGCVPNRKPNLLRPGRLCAESPSPR